MADLRFLFFEHFRLDIVNECVWRGEQALQLTPKAFALLRYLAEHAGQLVTKDELLNAVWPEVVVSENVLTTHVNVIRQALGDKAKASRYIETVHRRGYRFIAPLSTTQPVSGSRFQVSGFKFGHSGLSTQDSALSLGWSRDRADATPQVVRKSVER